jgi:hypothetical protein
MKKNIILTKEELQKLRAEDENRSNKFRILPKLPQTYYSNNLKEQQRCMNSYVRRVNKSIQEDYLWRSRFFIRQYRVCNIYRFEDGSGTCMFVQLRIYDKRDNKYIDTYGSISDFCYGNGHRLWYIMNSAITEHFHVWRETDYNPYQDMTDYRQISCDETVANSTPLYDNGFYLQYH